MLSSDKESGSRLESTENLLASNLDTSARVRRGSNYAEKSAGLWHIREILCSSKLHPFSERCTRLATLISESICTACDTHTWILSYGAELPGVPQVVLLSQAVGLSRVVAQGRCSRTSIPVTLRLLGNKLTIRPSRTIPLFCVSNSNIVMASCLSIPRRRVRRG